MCIRDRGGSIVAEGGAYQVSQTTRYHGGAGIGTGLYGIGGTIEILGGRITAAGGRETGAGIGGGAGGGVDTIVIGGTEGEAPNIAAVSYTHLENLLSHMKGFTPFSELEMNVFHSLFLDYNILGGMPAVVAEYIVRNTFEGSLDTQKQLIRCV